jgi:hypothetical protein
VAVGAVAALALRRRASVAGEIAAGNQPIEPEFERVAA